MLLSDVVLESVCRDYIVATGALGTVFAMVEPDTASFWQFNGNRGTMPFRAAQRVMFVFTIEGT